MNGNQYGGPVNGGRRIRRRFKFEPVEEKKVEARFSEKRIAAMAGIVALVLFIAWFLKPSPPPPPPAIFQEPQPAVGLQAASGSVSADAPAETAAATEGDAVAGGAGAFIQALRLDPPQPSRQDTIRVAVDPLPTAPSGLTYRYQWRVNGRIVADAKEETLNLSAFKRGDIVTAVVTPFAGGTTAGFTVESRPVAIHAASLSLELKDVKQSRKVGEPLELQLAAATPEGTQLTFSLAAPLVEGMTIDPRSGRITWRPQPNQKGAVRFGVAVEDDNATKVTKVFEINIE